MADIVRKRLVVIALGLGLGLGLGLASCKGDSPPGPAPVPPPQPPVVSLAPTAAFTAVATANALEPVTFDASASASKDGSALQYVWDFGNGQRGGGRTITRTFGTGGARSVTLTVVDTANRSSSLSKSIAVNPPSAPASMVTAQGVVKGLDGKGIAGVLVAQVGGAAGVTTDTAGKASMSLGTGTPLTLRFTRAGYADQVLALRLPATSGTDAYFDVVMRTRDAALTLADAAIGGTLTGRDGAVLTLPANALVNGAGAAVTGAVQIAITPVDPTLSGGGGFPGGFEGLQPNGTSTPIVSYGTTEYVLTAGGQGVQVAPGKTATIELPLYATRNLNGTLLAAGDSTPLWSLDESTGMWVQEGTGTVVASAPSPSGLALRATVTHFSWWNGDIGFTPYGPEPKCVYDTDIGIPGGNDTFATATICNILAETDNGPAPSPSVVSGARHSSAATATARFAGYAVRKTVPIAGGVPLAVPPGINISLKALALNGTWGGSAIVNGPPVVRAEAIIKMRPLFTVAGPTPEAITLPFDGTRSLSPLQPTALFTFEGQAVKYARVMVSPAAGSILNGRVRLLQGTTVLGSATLGGGNAQVLAALPANGTHTVEITNSAAAAFRLQVDLLGGPQEEVLAIPLNITRNLGPYVTFKGTVTVAAPTTVYVARVFAPIQAADLRLLSASGTVLLDATGLPDASRGAVLTLPAAGTYTIEVRARNPASAVNVRLTLEQSLWVQIAPAIDIGGVYNISDAQADKNGRIVVAYAEPVGNSSRVRLQRWTGSAWEAAAADLVIDKPCVGNGTGVSFTIDNANRPVVLNANRSDPSTATFLSARRYTSGAWQALGPNDGKLPLASAFGNACLAHPAVVIGADDAPVVAYGYDNSIVVQRFDGTQWKGLAKPDTSGDVFALQSGTYDLKTDAAGRIWFVTGSPTFSAIGARVRRFDPVAIKWDTIGGILPQTNTSGLLTPRLRFDAAGQPVIAWIASVGTGGVVSAGTAVYRYDGTAWSTTGGYNPSGTRNANGPNDLGFTFFNGEALVSWTSSNPTRGGNGIIVQRNTAAGWTPIGAGNGEIPQFSPGGVTEIGSYSSKLVPVGNELYLVLVSSQAGVSKLVLLRKVPN
jgi:hypothetical protein